MLQIHLLDEIVGRKFKKCSVDFATNQIVSWGLSLDKQ